MKKKNEMWRKNLAVLPAIICATILLALQYQGNDTDNLFNLFHKMAIVLTGFYLIIRIRRNKMGYMIGILLPFHLSIPYLFGYTPSDGPNQGGDAVLVVLLIVGCIILFLLFRYYLNGPKNISRLLKISIPVLIILANIIEPFYLGLVFIISGIFYVSEKIAFSSIFQDSNLFIGVALLIVCSFFVILSMNYRMDRLTKNHNSEKLETEKDISRLIEQLDECEIANLLKRKKIDSLLLKDAP